MRSGLLILTLGAGMAAMAVSPAVAAVADTAAPAAPAAGAPSATAGPQSLVGTFRVTAGACNGTAVSGSTFRMVLPSGNAGGPFVSNNDSACGDHSFTLLAPGTDDGLVTGGHQPEPSPAFDGNGNGLAARITKPTRFYGVDFATSTNPSDPQTGVAVAAPTISVQDGKLTGDLRAFAASWNRQEFNQGAPKPDGSTPGNTAAATGTYNPSTGAFSLNWASQIQGGPFNNFTGLWHLEGTFVPASGGSTTGGAAPAGSNGGSTAGGSSGTAPGATPTTAASGSRLGAAPSPTPGATNTPSLAPPTTAAGPAPAVASPTTAAPSTDATVAAASGSESAASQPAAVKTSSHSGGAPIGIALIALALLGAAAAGGWFVFTRSRRQSSEAPA